MEGCKKMKEKKSIFKQFQIWVPICISFLALILSGVSLYIQQNNLSPKLEIEQFTPEIETIFNEDENKSKIVTFNEFKIKNNGGKSVTFEGIYPPSDGTEMVFGFKNDKLVDVPINMKISLINSLFQNVKNIEDLKETTTEELQNINNEILVGNVDDRKFIVVFDVFKENKLSVDTVFLRFELRFSNNEILEFKQAYRINVM